jgi:translation initiation factor 1
MIMKSKTNKNEGMVYSTEFGKTCPKCGNPVVHCACRKVNSGIPRDGIVRIGRETKGRKGSGVTVITGLPLDEPALKDLAKQFKQKCGTGGTVKSGTIEIQGDHRDLLKQELIKLGYTVKLSGG